MAIVHLSLALKLLSFSFPENQTEKCRKIGSQLMAKRRRRIPRDIACLMLALDCNSRRCQLSTKRKALTKPLPRFRAVERCYAVCLLEFNLLGGPMPMEWAECLGPTQRPMPGFYIKIDK